MSTPKELSSPIPHQDIWMTPTLYSLRNILPTESRRGKPNTLSKMQGLYPELNLTAIIYHEWEEVGGPVKGFLVSDEETVELTDGYNLSESTVYVAHMFWRRTPPHTLLRDLYRAGATITALQENKTYSPHTTR